MLSDMKKNILFLVMVLAVISLVILLAPADRKEAYEALAQTPVVLTPDLKLPIASPLVLTGKARGPWYFEGSFPIELRDQAGAVLAQGVATAQGEWMTEEYVPFTAEIEFVAPAQGAAGILVLKKDNPSGLPEHDAAIELPVQF